MTFALSSCESTYKKETLQQSVRELAQKEVGQVVDVAEAGRTLGLRFRVPDLTGEISSGNEEFYKKMNALFLVLVRVALSSDVPPQFIVLDIVDAERPDFHLVFTRYVEDIRRSMAEALSHTDSQDRLLEEIVVAGRRVPFDPYELDLVRLVMMAADPTATEESSNGSRAPAGGDFILDEVDFEEFISKVTENKARRIFRERKDTRDEVMLREVRANFEVPREEQGNFRILLDLVSINEPTLSLPMLEKVLPVIAREAGALFKSYRFQGISMIEVIEKNTGKVISVPVKS